MKREKARESKNMMQEKKSQQRELFTLPEPEHTVGENEQTVLELLADLDAGGLLTGVYKAKGNILISIARGVDCGMQARTISVATSQLVKQLYDGLAEMPEPPRQNSADSYDTLRAVIEYMTEQAITNPAEDSAHEPVY
ncbi:MAG: hypothetical protein PUK59_07165 [Actinomycetaceae bacterium]|nr:hypothetical protein [Actinomycetaceae bacterium]MDY5854933.1 hypothetical protein [Arcanobacterium sp.]